jgi:hypothetical protein
MIKPTILALMTGAALLTAPTFLATGAQSEPAAQVDVRSTSDCAGDMACGRTASPVPASAAAALDPNRLATGSGRSPAAALGRAIATGATSKAP